MSCDNLSSRFPASRTETCNILYSLAVAAVFQGFSTALTCHHNGRAGDAVSGCLLGTLGYAQRVLPQMPVTQPCCWPEDFLDWMVTVIFRTHSALWVDVSLRTKSARSA